MSRLLFQCTHLYKSFGPLSLFDNISLSINQGEVFALIGENGAGKSTFLNLLAGTVLPDEGHLIRAPSLRIGFLPQELSLNTPQQTARNYLEEGPLSRLEQQMAACLEQPDRLAEWSELHEKYEKAGGYQRLPMEKILNSLKLDNSLLDSPMETLSSGQRTRVALAKALHENPDLLLLDEPTNHLDREMQDWLQNTLSLREGATVIVSHDRKFLNAVCNRLIELKGGKLSWYGGSYDFYLEEQDRILERQMKAYEAQEEERNLLKQKIKAMTFSKGKAALPTDRNLMAYDRRGEKHQKSLKHHLDVMKGRLSEIEDSPLPHPKPKSIQGLNFFPMPLASSVAIELENVCKAFENVLFTNLNKSISKGDRIILTGPNGAGKPHFCDAWQAFCLLMQDGIRCAPSARIAYMDQEVQTLPLEQTAFEYFQGRFAMNEKDLRSELHKAAIGGGELLNRPLNTLSIGQRKRFMLLSLILEKPNVLLLDEPTNHLDFLTLEAFEKALMQFEGAVLAVSHDQTFIERISTDIWVLGHRINTR